MIASVPEYFRIVLAVLAMIHGGEKINRHETICLAKAVYFEVRNQDIATQMSIASFMKRFAKRNRVTICEEIYDTPTARYPWVVHDTVNTRNVAERKAWELAVVIAALTLEGTLDVDVGKATHFLTPSIIENLPDWYDPKKVVFKSGDMEFLRLSDYR